MIDPPPPPGSDDDDNFDDEESPEYVTLLMKKFRPYVYQTIKEWYAEELQMYYLGPKNPTVDGLYLTLINRIKELTDSTMTTIEWATNRTIQSGYMIIDGNVKEAIDTYLTYLGIKLKRIEGACFDREVPNDYDH